MKQKQMQTFVYSIQDESVEQQLQLIGAFIEKDIREAILSIPSVKSSGPDGYSSSFFKACWAEGGPKVVMGGCNVQQKQMVLDRTGYQEGNLLLRYLGVPITANKLSKIECRLLGEKITKKISTWATKTTSYAGRAALINTVLMEVYNFWATIFILPQGVIKEGADAKYKKVPYVSWEEICKPKKNKGMGIKNVEAWKKASIAKLVWAIAQKKDLLWVKWQVQAGGTIYPTMMYASIGGNYIGSRRSLNGGARSIKDGSREGPRMDIILLHQDIFGPYRDPRTPIFLVYRHTKSMTGHQSMAQNNPKVEWRRMVKIPISSQDRKDDEADHLCTIYHIWQARNHLIIQRKSINRVQIIKDVKEQVEQRILYIAQRTPKYYKHIDKLLT
ncbi:hypothetical protein Cgig2_018899 [Carnegiea gigantea]|uniref:Uncharacterized protein n=1 Tax=Carnegiea gigantea TaxID=171969 RepID=A0A9Q1GFZ9_9CARY|nr:hypothetical protein Cgig2_018899 [Carnegiea gigantea]